VLDALRRHCVQDQPAVPWKGNRLRFAQGALIAGAAPKRTEGLPMTRDIRFVGSSLVALFLVAQMTVARASERVDLLLVFAVDVSRSIDASKFKLQRDGYVAAINSPRVIDAIRSGSAGRIAVCFIEWSGETSQKLVVDWSLIDGAESARRFSDGIVEAPRSFADRTSISAGIDFAAQQLERAPFESARRAIDVSGDGTNNSGREVTAARDQALAKGITINGLVILSSASPAWNAEHTNPPGGLAEYYKRNVVGGSGAFVMVAQDFESFGQAMINKLIGEVALASPMWRTAQR
jgi:hypothetical protein